MSNQIQYFHNDKSENKLSKGSSNQQSHLDRQQVIQTNTDQLHQSLQGNQPNIHQIQFVSNHNNYSMKTQIQQFKKYGPNIYLFFKLIKILIITFVVLFIFSIIPIAYNNTTGTTYTKQVNPTNMIFARTTLGSHKSTAQNQKTAKQVNEAIIVINIVIFFMFINYWIAYSKKTFKKIQSQMKLSNYKVLEISGNFSQSLSQKDDLKTIFSQYGSTTELQSVKNYGELIAIVKKIHQTEKDINQLNQCNEVTMSSHINRVIIKKQEQLTDLNLKLKQQIKINEYKSLKTIKYYLHMDRKDNCQKIIEEYEKQNKICLINRQDSKFAYNNQKLNIKRCESQSWGVYWQNQHVGIKEIIIPNIILFVIINITTLLVIFLFAITSSLAEPVYYYPQFTSNSWNESMILAEKNSTIVSSWCLSNKYEPLSEIYKTCHTYKQQGQKRLNIYVAISLIMIITRWTIKKIIFFMKPYLRYKDHAEESIGIFIHLFMNYTIVSIVVALAVQSNLFGTAMQDVLANLMTSQKMHTRMSNLQEHFDYDSSWYLDYGYQLILNYIFLIFLPHALVPIYLALKKRVKKYFMNRSNQNQQNVQLEQRTQFELQDNYANLMMNIVVGMTFAGLMPVLIPLILLNLILKFFIFKYTFVYLNKVSKITDRLIADKCHIILIISCLAYCCNSIWGLGVQKIFKPTYKVFDSINQDSNARAIVQALMVFIRRLVNSISLPIFFLIGVTSLKFNKKIYDKMISIKSKFVKKDSQEAQQMYKLDKNSNNQLTHSYSPLNNHSYQKIFKKVNNLILDANNQINN